MSEPAKFDSGGIVTAVVLPFDPDAVIADWHSLRVAMAHEVPDAFTRDEWAYLLAFLAEENLRQPFVTSFGARAPAVRIATRVARPRGAVAVWLPSNVSLLGPLALVLLSLTGNALRLKAASAAQDLAAEFLGFALHRLRPGPLREHLESRVRLERFDRNDPRNAELAASAAVRIVFGSDAAAAAVHALPHPVESAGISFVDRRSEAWLDRGALDDATLRTLIRVFAIYGQKGCTSPRRAVLLDAAPAAARELRDRLAGLWPSTVRDVPPHAASANLMARQWAAAAGWDAIAAPRNAAVLACPIGSAAPPDEIASPLFLPVVALPFQAAIASLPPNVQTIGHAFAGRSESDRLRILGETAARRVVGLHAMHHFGPTWDGEPFWRATFAELEVQG